MKPLLLLALLFAASVPGLAQSTFSSAPGVYVGLDRLNITTGDFPSIRDYGIGGTVGYRLGNGLDLGLAVNYSATELRGDGFTSSTFTAFRLGPTLGYTHELSEHFGLRTDASVGATFGGGDGLTGLQSIDAAFDASVFTRIPLGRRIALLPSLGVYGEATRLSSGAYDEVRASFTEFVIGNPSRLSYTAFPGRSDSDAGFQFALPISVSLTDRVILVLEPFLRYGFRNFDRGAAYPTPGMNVKVNF